MTTTTRPARRRRPRKRVIALAVVLALGGALWWTLLRGGDAFAAGTRTLDRGGITLQYPAGWLVHDWIGPSGGLGSTVAIIATQPWGLCLPFDINCHHIMKLDPSQISVELSRGILGGDSICDIGADRRDLAGRGPGDPPATGHLVRVGGRPALQTDYAVDQTDYYRSDEWRSWVVAEPGSTQSVYRIEARYQGPGTDRFRAQLDTLVASIRFADAPAAGSEPADCGAPFPKP